MNKVTKRIRISVKADEFLNRFKLQKQRYIETALIEKIQREYPIEFRNTFLR